MCSFTDDMAMASANRMNAYISANFYAGVGKSVGKSRILSTEKALKR